MRPLRRFANWFETKPRRTFLFSSALLTLLLYWRALGAPFVYDDLDQVVHNPNLQRWTDFVHRFLFHPVMLSSSYLGYGGSTYRPLFWLSFFCDRAVWGLSPMAFHATNILLHLVNANLVFALFRRMRVSVLEAAGIALLWLSLPVNTEVVAWVSGRSYALCTLFLLLSLIFALDYLRRPRAGVAVASFAAAVCAVLSHELGVVALLILALLVAVTRMERTKPFATIAGVFGFAAIGAEVVRFEIGVKSFSSFASIPWAAQALWEYVALTILPLHMSVERSTTLSLHEARGPLLLGALGLLVVMAYAIYRRKEYPVVCMGLCWFVIGIAPFCVLINYQGIAERFVYFASIGLVAALVATFAALWKAANASQWKRVLAALVAVWLLWNLYRTSDRVADWSDEVRLYQSSLAATPKSASVHYNLAFSLRERGELAAAAEEYQRAIDLNDRFPNGYASLGDVYLRLNSIEQAQSAYRKALAQRPDDTDVLLNVGAAYQAAGALADAEVTWQKVVQLDSKGSAPHVNLGVLYLSEGRQKDAMDQFATAVNLKSNDIVPYYDLGAIYQRSGRSDLALPLYRKALEIKPEDEDTLRNLRMIQQKR